MNYCIHVYMDKQTRKELSRYIHIIEFAIKNWNTKNISFFIIYHTDALQKLLSNFYELFNWTNVQMLQNVFHSISSGCSLIIKHHFCDVAGFSQAIK